MDLCNETALKEPEPHSRSRNLAPWEPQLQSWIGSHRAAILAPNQLPNQLQSWKPNGSAMREIKGLLPWKVKALKGLRTPVLGIRHPLSQFFVEKPSYSQIVPIKQIMTNQSIWPKNLKGAEGCEINKKFFADIKMDIIIAHPWFAQWQNGLW